MTGQARCSLVTAPLPVGSAAAARQAGAGQGESDCGSKTGRSNPEAVQVASERRCVDRRFSGSPAARTLRKRRHPEFLRSVTRGKASADGQAVEALFKGAIGLLAPRQGPNRGN